MSFFRGSAIHCYVHVQRFAANSYWHAGGFLPRLLECKSKLKKMISRENVSVAVWVCFRDGWCLFGSCSQGVPSNRCRQVKDDPSPVLLIRAQQPPEYFHGTKRAVAVKHHSKEGLCNETSSTYQCFTLHVPAGESSLMMGIRVTSTICQAKALWTSSLLSSRHQQERQRWSWKDWLYSLAAHQQRFGVKTLTQLRHKKNAGPAQVVVCLCFPLKPPQHGFLALHRRGTP